MRPSASRAVSVIAAGASRSKAAKNRPSSSKVSVSSPSVASLVPPGTVPRIQPPCSSSPSKVNTAGREGVGVGVGAGTGAARTGCTTSGDAARSGPADGTQEVASRRSGATLA